MRETWSQWIQGRVQRLFSTETIFTAVIVWMYYHLAMLGKLDAVFTGALAPVCAYIWGRAKIKTNGKK